MKSLEDWDKLSFSRPEAGELVLQAPVQQSKEGGAGAFLGRAQDGTHWWIKTLNCRHGPYCPLNELIVGAIGELVGAPVPEAKTIEIADKLAGWEFRTGHKIEGGIASAKLAVDRNRTSGDPMKVSKKFEHRDRNDNAVRHVGYLALHDLCWDLDPQWLYDPKNDMACTSHDHGHFLTGSPAWTREGLLRQLDDSHPYTAVDPKGLNPRAIDDFSTRLEAINPQDVKKILNRVPKTWPASNEDLAAVGYFVCSRAPQVAERLRGLKP